MNSVPSPTSYSVTEKRDTTALINLAGRQTVVLPALLGVCFTRRLIVYAQKVFGPLSINRAIMFVKL